MLWNLNVFLLKSKSPNSYSHKRQFSVCKIMLIVKYHSGQGSQRCLRGHFSIAATCQLVANKIMETKYVHRPIRFQEHYIASSAIPGGLPRAWQKRWVFQTTCMSCSSSRTGIRLGHCIVFVPPPPPMADWSIKGWSHIHEFHGELLGFYEILKPLRFADEIAFEVFIRSWSYLFGCAFLLGFL